MDKLETIRTFVQVVQAGSFKEGAQRLGLSAALASKYVARLEERLGVRLLNRTTRSLSLTEAGAAYLQRSRQLLDDFEELEAVVQETTAQAKGTIRLSAPHTFGEQYLADAICDFLAQNPEVSVRMELNDRYVDIVEEGFDLAIRIGSLQDSSLYARKIGQTQRLLCAAPAYLERRGRAKTVQELPEHDCIIDTNQAQPHLWSFYGVDGTVEQVEINGRLQVNSALAVRQALLKGLGVAFVPAFAVREELQNGQLEVLLGASQMPSIGIYALYPHTRHLTLKVRLLIDFLTEVFAKQSKSPFVL